MKTDHLRYLPFSMFIMPEDDKPAWTRYGIFFLVIVKLMHPYLYSTITGYPNRRKSWMAQSETREAAEHFSLTFFPWANPTSSDQDRDDDFARIITDTLTVRIWLFGQLDTYEFEWEGVGQRGIVINPGLVKRKWRSDSRDGGGEGDVVVHVVDGAVVAM